MKMQIRACDLSPGHTFSDGAQITNIHQDESGTWVETDDGDKGYLNTKDPNAWITIID